jgi:hypothetical protein
VCCSHSGPPSSVAGAAVVGVGVDSTGPRGMLGVTQPATLPQPGHAGDPKLSRGETAPGVSSQPKVPAVPMGGLPLAAGEGSAGLLAVKATPLRGGLRPALTAPYSLRKAAVSEGKPESGKPPDARFFLRAGNPCGFPVSGYTPARSQTEQGRQPRWRTRLPGLMIWTKRQKLRNGLRFTELQFVKVRTNGSPSLSLVRVTNTAWRGCSSDWIDRRSR